MGQIQSFVHNQAKCPATELKHPQLPGELFELGEMVAEELVFFLLLFFFFPHKWSLKDVCFLLVYKNCSQGR